MRTEAGKYRSSRYVEYVLFFPSCGLTVSFSYDRKDIIYPQGYVQPNVDKSTCGTSLCCWKMLGREGQKNNNTHLQIYPY